MVSCCFFVMCIRRRLITFQPQSGAKLLRRFENQLANPHSGAAFRGSLVDERMFAIDINEWELANLLEEKRAERLAKIHSTPECAGVATESPSTL